MSFLKLFSWLRTAVLSYVRTRVRLTLLCQTIDLCTFLQRSLAAILLCFPFLACSSVFHQPKLRSASAITCSVIKCSCCVVVRQPPRNLSQHSPSLFTHHFFYCGADNFIRILTLQLEYPLHNEYYSGREPRHSPVLRIATGSARQARHTGR